MERIARVPYASVSWEATGADKFVRSVIAARRPATDGSGLLMISVLCNTKYDPRHP